MSSIVKFFSQGTSVSEAVPKTDVKCRKLSEPLIPSLKDVNFDVQAIMKSLKGCKEKKGDILIDDYLEIFTELNKLILLAGNIFVFAVKLIEKIVITLAKHRKGENGEHYRTLRSMVDYEKKQKIDLNSSSSGTESFFQLHKFIKFCAIFVEDVFRAKDEDKLGMYARKAYDMALAKYDNWIIVKTVHLAVYTMPTRMALIENATCGDKKLRAEFEALIPSVIVILNDIFNISSEIMDELKINKFELNTNV